MKEEFEDRVIVEIKDQNRQIEIFNSAKLQADFPATSPRQISCWFVPVDD